MEPSGADPISMLITGGGGVGGGALTAYVLTKLASKNGSGSDDAAVEMRSVASKLDHTNELLNELLRSHARLEGLLQHSNQRG